MLRVHLGPRDLTRIRLADGVDVTAEIQHSLQILYGEDRANIFGSWRRLVTDRSPHDWRLLGGQLVRRYAAVEPLGSGRLRGLATGAKPTASIAQHYVDVAIAPYWSSICGHVRDELRRLGGLIAAGGLERLLVDMGPLLSWEPPVLTIAGTGRAREIALDGRGFTVQPLFFSATKATLRRGAGASAVLRYPIRHRTGWCAPRPPAGVRTQRLQSLIGGTRSEVLAALAAAPSTTTELASRLHLSLASASQHAKVLREAGLIVSVRRGRTVSHEASAEGRRLLDVVDPPGAPARDELIS